jgi:hypothetical protein
LFHFSLRKHFFDYLQQKNKVSRFAEINLTFQKKALFDNHATFVKVKIVNFLFQY